MSKTRLTDLAIRSLPIPQTGQKLYIDAANPGFGVRVSQGGTKTFVAILGANRTYRKVGRYPDMTLREARQEAKAMQVSYQPQPNQLSIPELITAYLDDCRTRLRSSTVERYEFALAPHRNKVDLTTSDPNEVKALKAFYNWCLDRDLVDRNPLARRRVTFNTRDRVLTDNEVAAIWHYGHPPYSDIVKLLLLTGQRRRQIHEFDPAWCNDNVITFPASVMKSNRPHTIPIIPVFEGLLADRSRFNSWSKAKVRIDKHTGVTDWVLHDLRRYFSTTMAKLEVPLHVTEHIMDHRTQVTGVAATYNRYSFLPEMHRAYVTFHQHIATITAAWA